MPLRRNEGADRFFPQNRVLPSVFERRVLRTIWCLSLPSFPLSPSVPSQSTNFVRGQLHLASERDSSRDGFGFERTSTTSRAPSGPPSHSCPQRYHHINHPTRKMTISPGSPFLDSPLNSSGHVRAPLTINPNTRFPSPHLHPHRPSCNLNASNLAFAHPPHPSSSMIVTPNRAAVWVAGLTGRRIVRPQHTLCYALQGRGPTASFATTETWWGGGFFLCPFAFSLLTASLKAPRWWKGGIF